MKKLIALLCLVISMTMACCAQQRLFSELTSLDGVSSVYIGSGVMRTIGARYSSYHLRQVSPIVDRVDALEVINAEGNIDKVRARVKEILKQQKVEAIIETKDADEECTIYVGTEVIDGFRDKLFIITDEGDEYSVVYVRGRIKIE